MRPSLKAPVKVLSQAFTLAIALSLTSAFSYAEEVLAPLTQLHCRDRRQATELISQDTRLFDSELTAGDGTALPRGDRQALLTAIDHSLDYMSTPGSIEAYSEYPVEGITHDRVRRSLQRFRTLMLDANSAEALQQAVAAEFDFYQAIGQDEEGTVAFTGYFEPTYKASLTPSEQYRYPIYRAPSGLDQWAEPHPTRAELEGTDGLQADKGPLKGLEIAWLPTRLEAFLIQVQGSARLELDNGTTLSVGYDGRTNYPYVSMGRELINDGIIPEDELTLPVLLE
ncbi:MAG: MltA domain-containing protein, partial [Cyanobacteria bacterium J06632_3]